MESAVFLFFLGAIVARSEVRSGNLKCRCYAPVEMQKCCEVFAKARRARVRR